MKAAIGGAMRPDCVPTTEGERSKHPGYTIIGRLFAVGCVRGLMGAIEKQGR